MVGPSPPPHYGTCLPFYREKDSAFSSLVDARRIVRTHAARRSHQLLDHFFLHSANKVKSLHGGIYRSVAPLSTTTL